MALNEPENRLHWPANYRALEKILGNQKVLLLIPAALAVLLYLPTVQYGNAVDDYLVILENDFVQQGFSGIPDLMTHNYADGGKNFNDGLYRPLSTVSFAIEVGILGEHKPGFSHFINALLYGLLVWLSGLFLLRLNTNRWIIFVFLLLFAAHPVHTEVMANIKGRDDLMAMLFGVGFGLFFSKAMKEKAFHYITAGVFLVLALLSKETALTFFVVFPMLMLGDKKLQLKKLAVNILPFAAITGLLFLIRYKVINSMAGEVDPGLHGILNNPIAHSDDSALKLGTAFKLQFLYALKMLWPHPLIHDYSYNLVPLSGLGNIKAIAGLLLFLASAGVGIYYGVVKRQLWALALGFYTGTLFITSNILVEIGALFAERFLFIPSFGFLLAIAWGLHHMFLKQKAATLGLVSLALAGGVYQSINRSADWKDNLTLFGADLEKGTESARVHYNYASEVIKVARSNKEDRNGPNWQLAESNYLKALEIHPEYFDALNNIGTAYHTVKAYPEAERHLKKVIAINPRYAKAMFNLGLVYNDWEKYQACIDAFKQYTAILPNNGDAWYMMGKAAGSLQRFDEAEGYLKRATQLEPRNAEFFSFYGLSLAIQNKNQESERALLNAIAINNQHVEAHKNLVMLYLNTKGPQKALAQIEVALRYLPNHSYFVQMRQNLTAQQGS